MPHSLTPAAQAVPLFLLKEPLSSSCLLTSCRDIIRRRTGRSISPMCSPTKASVWTGKPISSGPSCYHTIGSQCLSSTSRRLSPPQDLSLMLTPTLVDQTSLGDPNFAYACQTPWSHSGIMFLDSVLLLIPRMSVLCHFLGTHHTQPLPTTSPLSYFSLPNSR